MNEFLTSERYLQLLQTLESYHAAGVEQLPKPKGAFAGANMSPPESRIAGSSPPEPGPPEQRAPVLERTPIADDPPQPLENPPPPGLFTPPKGSMFSFQEQEVETDISTAPDLQVLREEVAACTRCQELASTRTQTVFGVGNPQARLCFMGEAPGADEDRLGEPFVGRAGQLLNKILEACHLRREDVYILNVLKCRPPGNRNPAPDESQNCRRFLNRQLELISPEYICCLGAVAAQNLLDTTSAIGRLRGSVHEYRGIKVVCTYHPAYLLRNPSAKRHTWDDMKLLMRIMGTPVD